MKTAGGTLREYLRENFPGDSYYPTRDDWPPREAAGKGGERARAIAANVDIDHLVSLPPERLKRIRMFTGHFPLVAAERLEFDLTLLTILRDPVDRTVSYLRACKYLIPGYGERTLEEIYEDPWHFPTLIHNHQTKLFATTVDDGIRSPYDLVEVDRARLELAKERLEGVDAVGLQERFDEFLAELHTRFGWRFAGGRKSRHRVPGPDASEALRRRIAADNEADIEFYEHARALVARRRARGTAGSR